MLKLETYIADFKHTFLDTRAMLPWEIIDSLESFICQYLQNLDQTFTIENQVAIHQSATVEQGVVIKGPVVISADCFIGANAYLRGPIFLDKAVKIGPGTEIKQSIIMEGSAMAHFNYIGNSIIGRNTNFEAGSICANHYNERQDKRIFVKYNDEIIDTHTNKFGALVGDGSKIGANAVLSPGTILEKNSIVGRLELIDQLK